MRSKQVSSRTRMDFIAGALALFATAIMILATDLLGNTANAAESQLERGTYLVHGIVACGNCHTPKGPDGHALVNRKLRVALCSISRLSMQWHQHHAR